MFLKNKVQVPKTTSYISIILRYYYLKNLSKL